MSDSRRAIVSFKKHTKKSERDMTDYIESFTYTDIASGSSDSCAVDLDNIDYRFLNGWLPTKGERYVASITAKDWAQEGKDIKVNCGTFVLDDYSFSGRPLKASLNAVSAPSASSFSTKKRTKTWKSITIQQIAKVIAKRYSLSLCYDAPSIKIKSLEQKDEVDSSFLSSLCDSYGISMKIFYSRLVLYSRGRYEKKKAVRTIDEKDMEEWSVNDTLAGCYTGAKYSYTNPKSNKTVSVKVGKGSRWLTVSGEASSESDAKLKAYAAVNKSNEGATTLSFTIPADSAIVATATIKVTGLGKFDGKYFITKVTHSVAGGYKMSVECYKLFQRLGGK